MRKTTLLRLLRHKAPPKFLIKLSLLTGVPVKAIASQQHKAAAAHQKVRLLRAAVG